MRRISLGRLGLFMAQRGIETTMVASAAVPVFVCQQTSYEFCVDCPGFESCVCLSEGNSCPAHHITCYPVKVQNGAEGMYYLDITYRTVNCYDISPCGVEFPGSPCGVNNRCLITGPAQTVTTEYLKLGVCIFNPPGG